MVIQLPATAGLSPCLQPNDTDVHQPLRAAAAAAAVQGAVPPPLMPQRVPPGAPAAAAVQGAVPPLPMPQRVPPGAPAAAAVQGAVPPPPPPPHEVPPMSFYGPVLPPAAVSATAGGSDALSASSWDDVEGDL